MANSPDRSLQSVGPEIAAWFDSELGQELLAAEKDTVERVISTLFGMHLVQCSVDSRHTFFAGSPVQRCYSIIPKVSLGADKNCIVADNTEIPLAHESVDVVILHHALDFTDAPHQVLREASRILRPGGHLVIVGFNPLSLFGLFRLFKGKHKGVPWSGRFLGHKRLSDWLKLLQLTELRQLSGYYRAPFIKANWRSRSRLVESVMRRLPGHTGAFTLMLARKDIAGMTPLRSGWGLQRLITLPVAEPSTRKSLKDGL